MTIPVVPVTLGNQTVDAPPRILRMLLWILTHQSAFVGESCRFEAHIHGESVNFSIQSYYKDDRPRDRG